MLNSRSLDPASRTMLCAGIPTFRRATGLQGKKIGVVVRRVAHGRESAAHSGPLRRVTTSRARRRTRRVAHRSASYPDETAMKAHGRTLDYHGHVSATTT